MNFWSQILKVIEKKTLWNPVFSGCTHIFLCCRCCCAETLLLSGCWGSRLHHPPRLEQKKERRCQRREDEAAAQQVLLLQSVTLAGWRPAARSPAELQLSTIRLTERCCAGQHDNGPVSSSEWTEGERERERERGEQKQGFIHCKCSASRHGPRARGPENRSTHEHTPQETQRVSARR